MLLRLEGQRQRMREEFAVQHNASFDSLLPRELCWVPQIGSALHLYLSVSNGRYGSVLEALVFHSANVASRSTVSVVSAVLLEFLPCIRKVSLYIRTCPSFCDEEVDTSKGLVFLYSRVSLWMFCFSVTVCLSERCADIEIFSPHQSADFDHTKMRVRSITLDLIRCHSASSMYTIPFNKELIPQVLCTQYLTK